MEAESILYRHPHTLSYTSLLFKTIEVSSVKTCGFIASTPLLVYFSLSVGPTPRAWGCCFVNFQSSHITDPLPIPVGIQGESLPTRKYPTW